MKKNNEIKKDSCMNWRMAAEMAANHVGYFSMNKENELIDFIVILSGSKSFSVFVPFNSIPDLYKLWKLHRDVGIFEWVEKEGQHKRLVEDENNKRFKMQNRGR